MKPSADCVFAMDRRAEGDRVAGMKQLMQAAKLMDEILKQANTQAKASALIAKWSDKELGPNPLATAAALEARNQVYGWGR
jgi:hypothetical protein